MMQTFSATLLLGASDGTDVPAALEALVRSGQIGDVSTDGPRLRLSASGITLAVEARAVPETMEAFDPPMRTLRSPATVEAARLHAGVLTIEASAPPSDPEDARLQARAMHAVAAALVPLMPTLAVFWRTSWSLTRPETFVEAAPGPTSGRAPVGIWAGFATVAPRGDAGDAIGMVSYGLAPFLGREIELAPAPTSAGDALRLMTMVAQHLLDERLVPTDGQSLVLPEGPGFLTVRTRDSWLRPDVPALVIVGDDAVVDPETLAVKDRGTGAAGGAISRP